MDTKDTQRKLARMLAALEAVAKDETGQQLEAHLEQTARAFAEHGLDIDAECSQSMLEALPALRALAEATS